MNWIDLVLGILMVLAIIIGSRRGLFSGIMTLVGLYAGVVLGILYMDSATHRILSHFRGSPIIIALFSFAMTFLLVYLAAKILGSMFYKFASLHSLGNLDKMGGGIMGIFLGWIFLGIVLFVLIFLPLPDRLVTKIDQSTFAPAMRGTVAFIYDEGSSLFHPNSPRLLEKVKATLSYDQGREIKSSEYSLEDERYSRMSERREKIIQQMEQYFGP
jgi:uncharacterized membrane protein required for colicin V production